MMHNPYPSPAVSNRQVPGRVCGAHLSQSYFLYQAQPRAN